jgi:hypothetical protein
LQLLALLDAENNNIMMADLHYLDFADLRKKHQLEDMTGLT